MDLTFVHACIFAALGLLVAAIHAGLRSESALAWTAGALLCGAAETLVLGLSRGPTIELTAAAILVPAAYLCFGQAVGIATGRTRQSPALLSSIATLATLALLLAWGRAPVLVQTTPFQLACALALFDAIRRLGKTGRGRPVELALKVVLIAIASLFLVRIPLFVSEFDLAVPYLTVKHSATERVLMTLSAILTPPAIFLLLAKVIGGVIATYRTRAERDDLTGLLNRQAFERAIAEERRGGAVIFCDIDHFKRINDRYGHHAGDAVIRDFAAILHTAGHKVGRVGGEEFAILLARHSAPEAAGIADRLRARFQACAPCGVGAEARLSASFGVAEFAPGDTPEQAFVRADAALYCAKEGGRNRVVTFFGPHNGPHRPQQRHASPARAA